MVEREGAQQRCKHLLEKALARLLEHYEASLDNVKSLEIDFEGPRVIVRLEPEWAESLYLDASPDGVEATITLQLPENLDPETVEATVEELIENEPAFSQVTLYDVAYDPETGELNLTLYTATLNAQPTPQAIIRLVQSLTRADNK